MGKITEAKRALLLQVYKLRAVKHVRSMLFNINHAETHADELIGTDYEEANEANYGDEAAALRELAAELEEINTRLKMLILS